MAFADDFLPTLASIRAIPGQFGLRPHRVYLVVSSTSGTYPGDGQRDDILTELVEGDSQPPKVRWPKDEDVAMGLVPKGQATIGPITPAFSTGGTDLSDLSGVDLLAGDVRLLRITGPSHPDGADYRIVSVKADRAMHYMITAIPVGTQAG